MLCYRDKTFCMSPSCKNDCGRQLTEEVSRRAEHAGLPVAAAYFCGFLKDDPQSIDIQADSSLD